MPPPTPHGLSLVTALLLLGLFASLLAGVILAVCRFLRARIDTPEDDPHQFAHGDSFPIVNNIHSSVHEEAIKP